jgi:hypothetical protein
VGEVREGPQVVTMRELERLLEGVEPGPSASWDAEDGSDRWTWEPPRERVERPADATAALREHILRAVLASWDFREPRGWQTPLAQALAALPPPDAARVPVSELEGGFSRFSAAPIFRQLGAATVSHREVEYLLPLPPVAVRGLVDCLWQDAKRDWHILIHDTATGEGPRGGGLRELELRVALAARAVKEQFGDLPKTARGYRWALGKAVSVRGGVEKLLDGLSAAVGARFPEIGKPHLLS